MHDNDTDNTEQIPEEKTTLEVVQEQLNLSEEGESHEEDNRQGELRVEDGNTGETDGQHQADQGEPEHPTGDTTDIVDEERSDQGLTPEEIADMQARLAQLEPAQSVLQMIAEKNLSEADIRQALDVAALVNSDPNVALEHLGPLVEQLQVNTGKRLSPEVEQLVEEGQITEDAAQQYQEALIKAQHAEAQQQQYAQYQEQQQAIAAQQTYQQLQANANSWEQRVSTSDPDYNQPLYPNGPTKGQEVLQAVQYMVAQHGIPNSVEQQNQMLQAAYDNVNQKINGFRATQQIKGSPNSGQVKQTGDAPELKMGETDTLSIVRRSLGLG